MLELRQRTGFSLKILDSTGALLCIVEAIEDFFDSAQAIGESLITRKIDAPHAAAGQKSLDAIPLSEHSAGRELAILVAGQS
jgi:hypothetical protein